MQRMAFLVEVIVPDNTEIESVRKDIQTSIGFGKPVVTFRSQIKDYKYIIKETGTDSKGE